MTCLSLALLLLYPQLPTFDECRAELPPVEVCKFAHDWWTAKLTLMYALEGKHNYWCNRFWIMEQQETASFQASLFAAAANLHMRGKYQRAPGKEKESRAWLLDNLGPIETWCDQFSGSSRH